VAAPAPQTNAKATPTLGLLTGIFAFLEGYGWRPNCVVLLLALLSRHGRHGEAMTSMMLSRAARIAVQARKQVKQMFLNDVEQTLLKKKATNNKIRQLNRKK